MSNEQIEEVLNNNVPKYNGKAITGHHSYSASKYPHLADKGEVIYPATFNEHLINGMEEIIEIVIREVQ